MRRKAIPDGCNGSTVVTVWMIVTVGRIVTVGTIATTVSVYTNPEADNGARRRSRYKMANRAAPSSGLGRVVAKTTTPDLANYIVTNCYRYGGYGVSV